MVPKAPIAVEFDASTDPPGPPRPQGRRLAAGSLKPIRVSRRLKTRHEAVLHWTRGPRVLNLGCAQREYVHAEAHPYWLHGQLAERFERVVGVDIDVDAMNRLRAEGYEVVVADVEQMALGEKFETVVAGELIEHLSNPGLFLDATHRHLAPGGRLILTTPNPFAVVYLVQYWRRGTNVAWNPDHTIWLDAVLLRQLVERHGYRVVATELVSDYATRRGWKYRAFVGMASAAGALMPSRAIERLLANNVVVVAEARSMSE